MINWPLFTLELRRHWMMWGIFAMVLLMYLGIMIPMYEPEAMSMLEEWFAVLGPMMEAMGMVLGTPGFMGFMASYLYGFILLVFPMVFTLILANALLASYVDRGSIVSLVVAPVKRETVAFTQMKVLGTGIFLLVAVITVVQVVFGRQTAGDELDIGLLLLMNLGLLGLHLFIGSIGFFFSALCNTTKSSVRFGAGIPAMMFGFTMVGNMGNDWIRFFTVFSLFDPHGILEGTTSSFVGIVLLFVGAIGLFVAGIVAFSRKDLHI